jgi:hypothetical protein
MKNFDRWTILVVLENCILTSSFPFTNTSYSELVGIIAGFVL